MWAWGHSRHLEHFRERTADKMPVFLEFILQWNLQSNIVFNIWLINTENKHSENCAVCQEVLRTWRRKGYRRDSSVSYSPAGMAGGEAPVEPAQGWAQSGLMGGGYGKLQSSLPSRVGLVMVQLSFCIQVIWLWDPLRILKSTVLKSLLQHGAMLPHHPYNPPRDLTSSLDYLQPNARQMPCKWLF